MKTHAIQRKNGIKTNIGSNVKNQVIGVLVSKNNFMWNPSKCDCECNKACEIGDCLDKHVKIRY